MTEPPGSWPEVRAPIVRTAVSVGVASGAYGVSVGALGVAAGLSVTQTCALSVLMFTGGSQFALVGALGGGGSQLSGALSAVLLGARNGVYGVRLAPLLQVRGAQRFLAAHLVIDESTAVALGGEVHGVRAGRLGFWATGLAVFACWNTGTAIGALGASVLADPRSLGLDAAAPAAFLALVAPRLRHRETAVVAAIAVLAAVASTPFVAAGIPVLLAALVAVAAGLRPRTGDG